MNANQVIVNWVRAYRAAEDNPKKLLSGKPGATEECVQLMEELDIAQNALLALKGEQGLPEELQAYFVARDDSGCGRCWLSSRRSRNHPECNEKIDRYFEAQKNLVRFAEALE